MVREANVKQATAEKQLKEAQGKVCEAATKPLKRPLLYTAFYSQGAAL